MHYNEHGHLDGCTATVGEDGIGEIVLQIYYRTWGPLNADDSEIELVYRSDDCGERDELSDWIDSNRPLWWLDIVDAMDMASVDFWR